MTKTMLFETRYDHDAPGPYCMNHRSVFCVDVQTIYRERWDVDYLAEMIGSHIGKGFVVSLPIYPTFCIWEVISYDGVNHELLGPMAEMTGRGHPRHKAIGRLLPGESAADLAMSLRDNYEAEIEEKVIELQNRPKPGPGVPDRFVPRCTSPQHSMRYQRLLMEMLNPTMLENEDAREQTHAVMWTFHYHKQCLFCWTKANMADAIRVSPDFAVEAANEGGPSNHDDLIPTSADTNKRSSTAPPW